MNGLLATSSSQMSQFQNHYSSGGPFGQMYSQQRPSFAIQEILGLNSCRQNSSPDIMDHSSMAPSGLTGMYFPGLNTNPMGPDPSTATFLREQQQQPTSTFCPWRFDLSQAAAPQSITASRFSGARPNVDDFNFPYKPNTPEEGKK